MGSEINANVRQSVADRAYHVCEYCLIHEDDTFWGCQLDHIISRKHGGANTEDNLAWACATCNSAKGSDIATLVGEKRELTRLFNPRSDLWAVAFSLDGSRIDPVSPVGEGTVALLQLNHSNRLHERRALTAAGRFPTVEALARMKE